jgi:predicted dehydrogenase
MVTIFGSGFGLYGYLPALIEGVNETVCLPRKYLKIIRSRTDLSALEEKILWVKDEDEAIQRSSKAVISVNPIWQFGIVKRCVALGFKGHFFLEKPLAESPEEADKLLDFLDDSGAGYSVGYSFLYIQAIKKYLSNNRDTAQLLLNWEFMAYHFAKNLINWKRFDTEGGGVLRFYGIHVIALLVEAGYSGVVSSELMGEKEEEPSRWEAIFSHSKAVNCHVMVDSRSENSSFSLTGKKGTDPLVVTDPFELNHSQVEMLDRRFTSLVSFICDLDKSVDRRNLYREINRMWRLVENRSVFNKRKMGGCI